MRPTHVLFKKNFRACVRHSKRQDHRIFQLRWRLWTDLGPARQAMLGIDGFSFMAELREIALAKRSLPDALEAGRMYRSALTSTRKAVP